MSSYGKYQLKNQYSEREMFQSKLCRGHRLIMPPYSLTGRLRKLVFYGNVQKPHK